MRELVEREESELLMEELNINIGRIERNTRKKNNRLTKRERKQNRNWKEPIINLDISWNFKKERRGKIERKADEIWILRNRRRRKAEETWNLGSCEPRSGTLFLLNQSGYNC